MIDHFNAVPAATSYLSEMQGKLAISVITRAEVLAGFEGKDRRLARQLLDRFPLLIIDREIADIAATLPPPEPVEDAGRPASRGRTTSQAETFNSRH
jgi:hypothetical protein